MSPEVRSPGPAAERSLWSDAVRRLRGDRLAMICLVIILVYTAVAILAGVGVLAPDYAQPDYERSYEPPSRDHLLPVRPRDLLRWIAVAAETIRWQTQGEKVDISRLVNRQPGAPVDEVGGDVLEQRLLGRRGVVLLVGVRFDLGWSHLEIRSQLDGLLQEAGDSNRLPSGQEPLDFESELARDLRIVLCEEDA